MYHSFVAKSPAVLDLLRVVAEAAQNNVPVLITGERGMGKELFAEQLHKKSPRADKPFVRVNCFSFSAPDSPRMANFFASAAGGTVFLDEIIGLPLAVQDDVLALMQAHKDSVRVVSATSADLEKAVAEGTFKSELYYRLNVLPLHIPPLRERKEDIAPLAAFFLRHFSGETKKPFTGFSAETMRALEDCYWQGNVRELKNTVERACIVGTPPLVQADDVCIRGANADAAQNGYDVLAADRAGANGSDRTLKTALTAFKAAYVKRILNETGWNQTEAAKILDVQRTYVSRLLNELHIR